MISQSLKTVPTNTPGIYCMFDLDGEPAYAGQTSKLRSRLRQHFIRQDSSVVSYGRLDIWDIAFVDWWSTPDTDQAEKYCSLSIGLTSISMPRSQHRVRRPRLI